MMRVPTQPTAAAAGTYPKMDRWSRHPEAGLALFSFLLHFAWELLQVPLYRGMPQAAHGEAILVCLQATLGDVAIALTAFWLVAVIWRNRFWLLAPLRLQWGSYVIYGLAVTVGLEKLATEVLYRWQYSDSMPVLPLLEVGVSPLAQWVLLPPLALWLTRRHVAAGLLPLVLASSVAAPPASSNRLA